MKPKYILAILVLLLFTSTVASARTVVPVNFYKNDVGDQVPPNTAIAAIYDGNTVTVTATPTNGATSLPTDFDIQGIYLRIDYVNSATARNDDPGAVKSGAREAWTGLDGGMPNLGDYFGLFSPVSKWAGATNIKSGGPIVITYPEGTNVESTLSNTDGYSIVVKVSWNGNLSNWVGGKTNIPEFPTMVLPVAAIIGLLFISGRKRKE